MRMLVIVAAGAAFLAATAHVPFEWTHSLSGTCYWAQRPHTRYLGRGSPDARAAQDEARCWAGRGSHDPAATLSVKTLLRTWPSQADLAAWNGEPHANEGPFPAGE